MKQNDFYEVDGCMDFIPVKLIEEYKDVKSLKVEAAETGFKIFVPSIYRFPKANEPQKPVVPQCVIDWVNDSRESDYFFEEWFDRDYQPKEVRKWLNLENKRQADINALALVTLIVNGPDAVTVEKEKLYTVEIPNSNIIGNEHTVLMKNVFNQIVMVRVYGDNWRTAKGYRLTESEIKRDFDWAFRWAKEVTE